MTDSKFCEHGVNVGLENPPVFCGQCPPDTIATLRADLARVTGERDSYAKMGTSLQRRMREVHATICGEANLSPAEHHAAIMEALGKARPWDARETDLAQKIAGDPTIVRGPYGTTARCVGAEADRAEKAHRTLCADSAPFLIRKAIAWMVVAERERDEARAKVAGLSLTIDVVKTCRRLFADAIAEAPHAGTRKVLKEDLAEMNRYAEALGGGK